MKVCPKCGEENELYRVVKNITIFEDILIDGVLEDGYVDYTVSAPDISDGDNEAATTTYMCSYCQHVYSGYTVDEVYFNEMVEKKEG